jgi:hypothetical protein
MTSYILTSSHHHLESTAFLNAIALADWSGTTLIESAAPKRQRHAIGMQSAARHLLEHVVVLSAQTSPHAARHAASSAAQLVATAAPSPVAQEHCQLFKDWFRYAPAVSSPVCQTLAHVASHTCAHSYV